MADFLVGDTRCTGGSMVPTRWSVGRFSPPKYRGSLKLVPEGVVQEGGAWGGEEGAQVVQAFLRPLYKMGPGVLQYCMHCCIEGATCSGIAHARGH